MLAFEPLLKGEFCGFFFFDVLSPIGSWRCFRCHAQHSDLHHSQFNSSLSLSLSLVINAAIDPCSHAIYFVKVPMDPIRSRQTTKALK